MMKLATWGIACASALLVASHGAVASDRVSAPQSGTYQALLYVQSVSGSGCLDMAGFVFTGSMSFGGLSATKNYLRALETGDNFAVDALQLTGGNILGREHPARILVENGEVFVQAQVPQEGDYSLSVTSCGGP